MQLHFSEIKKLLLIAVVLVYWRNEFGYRLLKGTFDNDFLTLKYYYMSFKLTV